MVARIITLRKKPTTPEELSSETIEESLDFSIEYLTRYEEEVNRSKEVLQEKDRLLQVLRDENDQVRSEKDSALAIKEQEMQAQQTRNAELEAELAEYHRKDRELERRRQNRKRTRQLIIGIVWKLAIVATVIGIAGFICSKVNSAWTNAVSIVVGLIGAVPAVISFIKRDLQKYKSNEENEDK